MVGVSWTVIGLAADAAIAAMFYGLSHRISYSARCVENSPEFELSPELVKTLQEAPDHKVPYCCVTGLVQAQGNALESHYRNEKGVIQKLMLVEHRTKRTQGFWADCRRVVRSAINFAPFKLVGCRPDDPEVLVTEPLSAMYLMDDLSTTYDKYQPTKTTAVEKGIDRVFGDVSKGFQETEQMLNIGTPLVGIGQLVMSRSGALKIMPPEDKHLRYILTRFTKDEVVKILKYRSHFAKVAAIIFGLIGAGALTYMAVIKCRQLWEGYQMRKMLAEIRTQRLNVEDGEEIPEESEHLCVICLLKPREVIVLNCGHASMCQACSSLLPEPKKCPICRQPVAKITPLYMS